MRHLGNLPDEKSARAFGDHLVTRGIRNEVEPDSDGSWLIWVNDEDQQTQAQAELQRFRADPNAAEFRGAETQAAKVRDAEARDLASYRKRVRSGRQVIPKFGGSYGVGVLTYALIFGCCTMAFFSDVGNNKEALSGLIISDPSVNGRSGFLPEVLSGEIWRLFTPIFIHHGHLHLIFNMIWLFQLGCMIEGRQGSSRFALLVAGTALLSNLAQYFFHGPYFGGMSGVVYGLAGYIWIRGKFDSASGLYLDPISFVVLAAGFVGAYTGYLGPNIANTAHLVGLLCGMAWGGVTAFFALRNPK